ncbi:MAG: hypothetical protein ACXITV_03705 [Luteibaculaceae bacterium]
MKLEKVLDNLNSFEKNSFLKIIDGILAENPKNYNEVEKILSETSKDLKNIDNINIAKVFNLIQDEFRHYVKNEFTKTTSQLDLIIDLISREGNAIMKQDWFARLYEKEISTFEKKIKQFNSKLESDDPELDPSRIRDYKIYKSCLSTAYNNDEKNNQERKITSDEQSILITLSKELGLSQEECKLINYSILPVIRQDIDNLINELKGVGVIFYSKKNSKIYVPDEIVAVLRKVRGKEVSDKYVRRVLINLKEPQINLICRKHGVEWKGVDLEQKIDLLIKEGVSFKSMLGEDIFKEGTNLTDKKKFINEFFDTKLKITPPIKGTLLEDKIENLVKHFENLEKDEKVGISLEGYDRLLNDIGIIVENFSEVIKSKYEFQEENVLRSSYLLDYNIKPRDILELMSANQMSNFVEKAQIKSRGDLISNILEAYTDSENLFLENYELIAYRDYNNLKANGIVIKEAELGVKFEELTKSIFESLGFNVDEDLRKKLNSSKDQADILLRVGKDEIIIVECKTSKDSSFSKFSSVSRQLKAYSKRIDDQGYKVIKSILIAPEFSDDFIKECGIEYELNLSLITANSMIKILEGFKNSKLKQFPHNLLMRDVVIQEDRVIKAITR